MKRQAGFSLLEMLVAVGISLVVIAATLAAFNDALHANETVVGMADMTANLRAGMNMLVHDLIQAGSGIPTGGIPIPSGGAGLPISRPSPPNMNYTFPVGYTTLPAVTPGPGMGPFIPPVGGVPTDMVTILYADNSIPLNTLPLVSISPTGIQIQVDPSIDIATGNTALKPGDLIMFSNAQGNALQTVSSITGPQTVRFDSGDAFNLNGRSDPSGTIQQIQAPLGSGNYPPTTATRVWMITYYLDTTTDPAHVRLIRQVNFNTPQPVGEIIENLQVTYNYVDGVTNPVDVKGVPACTTPPSCITEHQIRMVNLFMSARSNTPNTRTGEYMRSNLWTQVSLRSLAYVNRYR